MLVRSVSESQGGHHARQWHGLGPMIALGYPPRPDQTRPDQGSPASCTPWCRQHRPQSEAAAQHNAPGRPVLKLPEICVVSEQVVGCRQGGRGGSMGGQAGRQAGRGQGMCMQGRCRQGTREAGGFGRRPGGWGGPNCAHPPHTRQQDATHNKHVVAQRSAHPGAFPRTTRPACVPSPLPCQYDTRMKQPGALKISSHPGPPPRSARPCCFWSSGCGRSSGGRAPALRRRGNCCPPGQGRAKGQ